MSVRNPSEGVSDERLAWWREVAGDGSMDDRCARVLEALRAKNGSELVYFFCETSTASGETPWHIRKAGPKGECLGGGADTPALCGRVVAWDVQLEVAPKTIDRVKPCVRCAEMFANPGSVG